MSFIVTDPKSVCAGIRERLVYTAGPPARGEGIQGNRLVPPAGCPVPTSRSSPITARGAPQAPPRSTAMLPSPKSLKSFPTCMDLFCRGRRGSDGTCVGICASLWSKIRVTLYFLKRKLNSSCSWQSFLHLDYNVCLLFTFGLSLE